LLVFITFCIVAIAALGNRSPGSHLSGSHKIGRASH
jgi:hypothetical protein